MSKKIYQAIKRYLKTLVARQHEDTEVDYCKRLLGAPTNGVYYTGPATTKDD